MNDWTKEQYTSGDSLFTKTFFGCQYRKKAPLAGEATRLFNYLTVMEIVAALTLQTSMRNFNCWESYPQLPEK